MLTRIFRRVRGKAEDRPPTESERASDHWEPVGDEKAGANAVEHLGGFDPNHLIDDPGRPGS